MCLKKRFFLLLVLCKWGGGRGGILWYVNRNDNSFRFNFSMNLTNLKTSGSNNSNGLLVSDKWINHLSRDSIFLSKTCVQLFLLPFFSFVFFFFLLDRIAHQSRIFSIFFFLFQILLSSLSNREPFTMVIPWHKSDVYKRYSEEKVKKKNNALSFGRRIFKFEYAYEFGWFLWSQ